MADFECIIDQEDVNFLEDLAEELRKINPVYNAEAIELENILFRITNLDKEERAMVHLGE